MRSQLFYRLLINSAERRRTEPMAAGRPRLVEVGAPIPWYDDDGRDGDGEEFDGISENHYELGGRNSVRASEWQPRRRTGLATRIVIGGTTGGGNRSHPPPAVSGRRDDRGNVGTGGGEDMMIMDDGGTEGYGLGVSSLSDARDGGAGPRPCRRWQHGRRHEARPITIGDPRPPPRTIDPMFPSAAHGFVNNGPAYSGNSYEHHHEPAPIAMGSNPSAATSHHYQSSVQPHPTTSHFSHPPPIEVTPPDLAMANSGESRMEVDDFLPKPPLVVLDGANVAYGYTDAKPGGLSGRRGRKEPDPRGVAVAARYFLEGGCRVKAVIPASWMRAKPRDCDQSREDALMVTPTVEALRDLKDAGLLCIAPPADDDDAYVLAMAMREDGRARRKLGDGDSRGGGGGREAEALCGGGYVLSNDFFRDAIAREGTGAGTATATTTQQQSATNLRGWLQRGSGNGGPGRISFAFADMDSMDAFGERELDFLPNPRHALVQKIERANHIRNISMS